MASRRPGYTDGESSGDELLNDQEVLAMQRRMMLKRRGENLQLKCPDAEVVLVSDQAEFLSTVTSIEYAVCHFFHPDFAACTVMDSLLSSVSEKHHETKFLRVDASSSPFLVKKLGIVVLPTLLMFHEGIVIDRMIGMDDLESSSAVMSPRCLEKRLSRQGAISLDGRRLKSKPMFAGSSSVKGLLF